MLTCWPLVDVNARLRREATRMQSTLHEGDSAATAPPAADGEASIIVYRDEESFELRGESSAVENALSQIHTLQAELVSLRLRHARRSSQKLDVPADFYDSMREVAAAL